MKIEFVRSGGFAGIRIRLAIDLGELPGPERSALEELVRETGFFEAPCECLSPHPDAFQYDVAIESEGRRHRVRTDDRGAPDSLRPLIERLVQLARERAR